MGDVARERLGDALTEAKGDEVRPPGRLAGSETGTVQNLAAGKTITLKNPESSKFPGRGQATLIDGDRGTMDHTDGVWQGFEGVDLVAEIDLGEEMHLERVTAGFIENQSARVFLPTTVEIAISQDGTNYTVVQRTETGGGNFIIAPRIKDIGTAVDPSTPVRYVRLTAANVGTCPDWHPRAGQKAWIFADEVILE